MCTLQSRYDAAVTDTILPPPAVIEQYSLDVQSVRRLTGGLINTSFRVEREDGSEYTLQRVNPIFSTGIQQDINTVTRHLDRKGLTTPLLIPTRSNALFVESGGEIWRLLSWVDGHCIETIGNNDQAREAGRILGRFHAALADFRPALASRRPGVHDLNRHLQTLQSTLTNKHEHPAHAGVRALAQQIDDLAAAIDPLPNVEPRLVHGDPKISNIVFQGDRAVCMIDLDTIARMPVSLELGDAFRSWCNLQAEDSPQAEFSVDRLASTLEGYGEGAGSLLTPAERESLPAATLLIATELAARFAADALNESYFGWDRERFESASEHNGQRAAAQLKLAQNIRSQLRELRQVVMTRL